MQTLCVLTWILFCFCVFILINIIVLPNFFSSAIKGRPLFIIIIITSICVSTGEVSLRKFSGKVLDFNATTQCPGSENKVQSSISFQCGKTMVRVAHTVQISPRSWWIYVRKACSFKSIHWLELIDRKWIEPHFANHRLRPYIRNVLLNHVSVCESTVVHVLVLRV